MMKRHASLVLVGLAAFLAAGCGSNNKDKIEGTKWTAREQKAAGGTLPRGGIVLDFSRDGAFEWTFGPGAKRKAIKGKYTLGSGDNVTFHFHEEFEGRKDHTEKITIADKTLTLSDSKGTIVFEKE